VYAPSPRSSSNYLEPDMDDTTDTKPENKWGTKNKKPHASQSFTEEQVHTLGVLFDTVLRGGGHNRPAQAQVLHRPLPQGDGHAEAHRAHESREP